MPKVRARAPDGIFDVAEYARVRARVGPEGPCHLFGVYSASHGLHRFDDRVARMMYVAGDVPFPSPERVREVAGSVRERLRDLVRRAAPRSGAVTLAHIGEALAAERDARGTKIAARMAAARALKRSARAAVVASSAPDEDPEAALAAAEAAAAPPAGPAVPLDELRAFPRFRAVMERWSWAEAREDYRALDERTRAMGTDEYVEIFRESRRRCGASGTAARAFQEWLGCPTKIDAAAAAALAALAQHEVAAQVAAARAEPPPPVVVG